MICYSDVSSVQLFSYTCNYTTLVTDSNSVHLINMSQTVSKHAIIAETEQ